jgi:hypothetical protein
MARKSHYHANDRLQLGDVVDLAAYQRDIEVAKLQQMQIALKIAKIRANLSQPATGFNAPPRTPEQQREDSEYYEWAAANPYQGAAGKARWQEARRKAAEQPKPAPFTWKGFLRSLLIRGPDVFSKPNQSKPAIACGEKPRLRIVDKRFH